MKLAEQTATEAIARLKRIEGQVGGLIRMIEADRECRDVVRQISAASHALDRTAFKILAAGLRACVAEGEDADSPAYTEDELEKLFLQLA